MLHGGVTREVVRARVKALGIEPKVVLRPTARSYSSWQVWLEIPDLSHLQLRFPGAGGALTNSRCLVAGSSGRPLARGRLLQGAQRVALSRWPDSDEVLLRFEERDSSLDYLLTTEALLRPGPRWLFRIAGDGLAYESRGHRVRPGQRYIVGMSEGPIQLKDYVRPVSLECSGIYGALLELPSALTPAWEDTIRHLGLQQARKIEVWPAGLGAAAWDGEGRGEWPVPDKPCVGILVDHPLASMMIAMEDGSSAVEVSPVIPGEATYVQLPALPVGVHRVHAYTATDPGRSPEPIGQLDVVMRARESSLWSPSFNPRGPLSVHVYPSDPTLAELWEGRVEIEMKGPPGRKVRCRADLLERVGERPLISKQLGPIELPLTPSDWRTYFTQNFCKIRNAQEAYDTARLCELRFSADDLGRLTLRCEREYTPLRWALRRSGNAYVLQLIDDTGNREVPVVRRLTFEDPCNEEIVTPNAQLSVLASGGLYVARSGKLGAEAAIIVPPAGRHLSDLGCSPRIEARARSAEAVSDAVQMASLWARARLPGNVLAAAHWRTVMRALLQNVFRLLCGAKWAGAEEAYASDGTAAGLKVLAEAIGRNPLDSEIGVLLLREAETLAKDTLQNRIRRLAAIAREESLLPSTAGPEELDRLTEFCLKLASDPIRVRVGEGEHLHNVLVRLMEMPTLPRAARFMVIATDHYLEGGGLTELHPNWRWE